MSKTINFSEFKKSLKETLFAFSFDVGGLFAGFIIGLQLGIFAKFPWAIAIYPAIVSAKGVISGLLSGRLSTSLHIGTVFPRFTRNTASFYALYAAIVVITLVTSLAMGLISIIFGVLFWSLALSDLSSMLVVTVATMALGLTLTTITASVAFVTFKKGLDPDVLVYPIMSTAADILITIIYALVLNIFSFAEYGRYILLSVCVFHTFLAIYILSRNFRKGEFRKTIRESLLTLLFVAFIVNVTGTVLKSISDRILENGRKEIYTVYPALIDMVGDVGSVVGSTATTKLALGLLHPSLRSIKNHSLHIGSAWFSSIIYFVFFGFLALIINNSFSPLGFFDLAAILLVANVIAVATIIFFSYAISIITFQKGLDPDNFVIPIESSFADSLTSIALLFSLILLG